MSFATAEEETKGGDPQSNLNKETNSMRKVIVFLDGK